MKLNKLLIATTLVAPATIAPLSVSTSCANAWGHKSPLSIGSVEKGGFNDPYANFRAQGDNQYFDQDGLYIPDYLQSNYIVDVASSVNYAYTTPVKTWTYSKDNKNYKLTNPNDWINDSSLWANANTSMTSSITDGDNKTQICSKNATLTANISFVDTIGQFINKYVTYALSYAVSQINVDEDFDIAWGGKPNILDKDKRAFWELMFANSNCHATGKIESFLKTTNANFQFNQSSFPVPSYKTKVEGSAPEISPATKKLLTGDENGDLAANNNQFWSNKAESGSGDDKYTTYTYTAVPVVIDFTNLTQRFINPQVSGSFFINDYYQNDKNKVTDNIGNAWAEMAKKTGDENTKPTFYKYDLTPTREKELDAKTNIKDPRLLALNPSKSSFVAFVTYNYVHWDKQDLTKNRYDTVTLSSLQTMMPSYLIDFKSDIYTHANGDTSAYIVDVNKADTYSTQLINLLSRNSNEGRTAHAKDLSHEYQDYLKFLTYLFGSDSSFVNATAW